MKDRESEISERMDGTGKECPAVAVFLGNSGIFQSKNVHSSVHQARCDIIQQNGRVVGDGLGALSSFPLFDHKQRHILNHLTFSIYLSIDVPAFLYAMLYLSILLHNEH